MLSNNGLRNDASPFYEPYEQLIGGWSQLHTALNELSDAYPSEQFVWRGQADASWGLWSSLYRKVAEQLGSAPMETDMVAAERRLLRLAREDWRLDGIPALPLFAQMQHVGVPTRLIDATLNPLIAAWFAVSSGDKDRDARLFAFTVKGKIQLNTKWNGNTPRWHPNAFTQNPSDWGTGLGRRVWLPPALHARIPAQSAAFLLDGVPADVTKQTSPRSEFELASSWTAAELREVASIPLKFTRIRPESRPPSKGLVFTYRISARAKSEIRAQLEDRFGYRFATIYADIEGLATYLAKRPDALVQD
ncbi:FRG domain-containing protein [Tessaracoccus sp. ZS01]|uniref:FRG domain-containing protein n=1 Tax=Tessaracoccus sp. ZS01 TaxID=1906324 RepID=UPI00096C58F6|nr:FRG domain-containing protein [Tessaracoccus sp. ZS01]MCG6568142.1 FRG domain-containing protein [Tessaracoccus sp. ZS01]OMG54065.1 hypothetical protein BJN44_11010 [Tessaracoccus sp. ZS01]